MSPSQQSPEKFYPAVFQKLVQQILSRETLDDIHTLVFILDQIAYKRKRQNIRKGVKEALRPFIHPQLAYHIFFHSSQSNPYLQAVDYFSWGLYVKWSRGEMRPYSVMRHIVGSETEVSLQ